MHYTTAKYMKAISIDQRKHRRFNDILSVIVAGLALYILVSPLLPNITLWWQQKTDKSGGHVYETDLLPADTNIDLKPTPKENRLVIPALQLDQEIYEGRYSNTLSKGLWRRPHTSTPDQGGNTVIAGHRFMHSKPGVLFHLDKLKEGERFSLYWQGKEHLYQVSSVKIVSPLALEVEHQTKEPLLTIYTCTPLWTAKQRLVIQATPLEEAI